VGKRVGVLILLLILAGVGFSRGWFRGGPKPDPSSGGGPMDPPEGMGSIQVEVLNASGVPGIARDATGCLRDRGFDVVYYGNARTYGQDPSVVIDRVGNPSAAALIGKALGIPEVRSEPDSTLLVDITVLLGPEWTIPGGAGEDVGESPAWWDLRRFFRKDEPREQEHL
jgi:hypothetical protein